MTSKKKLRKQAKAFQRDYEKMRGLYLDKTDELRELRGVAAGLVFNVIEPRHDAPPALIAAAEKVRVRFDLTLGERVAQHIRDMTRALAGTNRKAAYTLTDLIAVKQKLAASTGTPWMQTAETVTPNPKFGEPGTYTINNDEAA